MKLDAITLRDFGGTERATFPLAPVTLFTGRNGSGKTTLQDAIEWAFSGCNQRTNEAGAGAKRLIRRGARSCSVILGTTDGHTIERSLPPHGLSLSWSSEEGVEKAQGALERVLGCSGSRARLSLRTGRFFGLDAKQRQSEATVLLRLEPDAETITAEIAKEAKACGLPLGPALKAAGCNPGALLGKIQAATKARRTEVNKSHKEATATAARLQTEFEQLDDEPNPPTEKALLAAKQAVQQASEALGEQRARAQEVARQEASLARLRERLAEVSAAAPVDLSALEQRATAIESRLKELRTIREQVEARLHEQRQAQKEALTAGERLSALLPVLEGEASCPFRAGHPCASGQANRDALQAEAAELQGWVADIDRLLAVDVAAELQDVRERLQTGQGKLQEISHQLALARANDVGRAQQDVTRAETTLGQLQARCVPAPELEAAAQAAQAALDDLLEGAAIHARFVAAEKAARGAQETLAKLAAEKEALEHLVAWSGPNGLRKRILAENLGPFLEELCGVLDMWGMSARYSLDGKLEVSAAQGGAFVEWEELSDSEQLRVGLAHQVAFSVLTGLRIVVLDRMEALDAESQRVLFAACLQLAGAGVVHHFLLLGVGVWTEVPADVLWHKLERAAVAV